MPFDPLKRRPANTKPHVIAPDSAGDAARCIKCGATGWDIAFGYGACDPDSEDAKKWRRGKQDAMVGRMTGNYQS